MEVLNFKTLRPWILAALIVLIPIWLSDLFGPPKPTGSTPSKPVAAPTKPVLPTRASPTLDRAAFLASFTRQAGDTLIPCVRESLGSSGSVTFIGRLNRRGELTGLRMIEPRSLECAVEAARAMSFLEPAKTLTAESLELTWRFDW